MARAMSRFRRRKSLRVPLLPILLAAFALLSVLLFLYNFMWSRGSHQAQSIVEQFYAYEQDGDYGSAYELLHSQIKSKFPKEQYIQHRAYLFMQQLGASTFQFKLGETEQLSEWSMNESAPPLGPVYRVTVNQQLLTVYGVLAIEQDVFAAEEEGNWKILWSYHDPNGGN